MHFKIRKILWLPALLALAGCGPSVTHPSNWRDLAANQSYGARAPYTIGVGDQLKIKFFYTPDLNETVQVAPDGTISLMFAQDMEAEGKTPKQLAAAIRRQVGAHVRHPELVVIMQTFGSQKIYIGGEVAKPGPIILMGRETILQALDDAGWKTSAADPDRVILVRRGQDGIERVYPLSTEDVLSGEDMSQNLFVQPGDLLLVPPSGMVSFDRWVDRSIRQALPFNMNASAVYTNEYGSSSR